MKNNFFGEDWWKKNLQMSRVTFDILYNYLHPYLEKKMTHMRHPVGVEQRVAVTLWKLATSVEFRTLSTLFGLGLSTVSKVVNETCSVITAQLLHRLVQIPSGECLDEDIASFEQERGFPQAVSAIDGTLILIICPKESGSDYRYSNWFETSLAECAFNPHLIHIDVNWSRSHCNYIHPGFTP